jgi:hypothetical protein
VWVIPSDIYPTTANEKRKERPAGFSAQDYCLSSGLDISHKAHIGHKDNPMESFVPYVFFVATLTSGE